MHPSRHRQVSVYLLSALRPGDGQRYAGTGVSPGTILLHPDDRR
jgi:hypothetical protein